MIVDQLPGYSNKTNPYNELLCRSLDDLGVKVREYSIKQLVSRRRPDIVHVHWPEFALTFKDRAKAIQGINRLFLGMRLAKARGAKIIWTAHNLHPHERPHPDLLADFYRRWFESVDGIICLSEASKNLLQEAYGNLIRVPMFVIPHGDYRPKLKLDQTKSSARRMLDLPADQIVIGSFGAIRPYKNLANLIRYFKEVCQENETLLISGKVDDPQLRDEMLEQAGDSPHVRLDFRFLPDETLECYTTASDVIVLPYTKILNSGSALYALSVGRPVIAPRLGSLEELQSMVGQDWVRLYSGDLNSAALRMELDHLGLHLDRELPNLDPFEWRSIGTSMVSAYSTILKS